MADRDERKNWLWSRVAAIALVTIVATFVVDQANKWWMLNIYDIIEKGRHAWLPFLDVVFVFLAIFIIESGDDIRLFKQQVHAFCRL